MIGFMAGLKEVNGWVKTIGVRAKRSLRQALPSSSPLLNVHTPQSKPKSLLVSTSDNYKHQIIAVCGWVGRIGFSTTKQVTFLVKSISRPNRHVSTINFQILKLDFSTQVPI
jgi:hypothetical protein